MLLTIKDKEYGLEWGMLAFENLEDKLDISGHEIIGRIIGELANNRDRTLRELAYEAIKLWCRKNEKDCDLTYFDFVDWLDKKEQGDKQVAYISTSFNESWYQGKQVKGWIDHIINLVTQGDKPTEDKTKKKATPTRARKSSKTATSGVSEAKTTKS